LETYAGSYLSIEYPGLDMGKPPTSKQATAIERCGRMVSDVIGKAFGDGLGAALIRLARVYKVNVNGRFYLSFVSESTREWLNGLDMGWGDLLGGDK
jgi:hypothetical protein